MQAGQEPRPTGWRALDWFALVAVSVLAAALRLARLSFPREKIFDEVYYAKDACWYAFGALDRCGLDSPPNEVHPPLAKWIMASAIDVFGFDSFGWRIAAAVAGIVTVALLYVLARKILRSTLAATITSGLLAFDFLHFVQSRTAMLDVFVPLFGIAAVLFLVLDRDRLQPSVVEGEAEVAERSAIWGRPWRAAAGAAAGAAVAAKWSGLLVLLVLVFLTILWEIRARRADGRGRAFVRFLRHEGPSIALWLLLLPVVVYLLTYVGRFDGPLLGAPWSEGSWLNQLWRHHLYMLDFHNGLDASHSYQSPPWSWVLLKRPVSYFFCSGADCDPAVPDGYYNEIFAVGNPFVWWSALLALAYVAYRWARRRDALGPEPVIVAGFALTYLPWLALAAGRDAVFLFYLLPSVPFMLLALGYIAAQIGASWEAKASIALFVAAAVGLFAFYYPLLAGVAIPYEEWRERIWVFDDCETPRTPEETETTGEGEADETKEEKSVPPEGWCWI